MKAILAQSYGGPEVLELKEIEKPTPQSNEILVKIKASTVTAADTMMRTGTPYFGRLFIGLTKPKNPISGTGFAGDVVEVGQNVTSYVVSDKIYGESVFGPGTNAEYICLAEDGIIAKIPKGISYNEVASVADGALTSLNLLRDVANIKSGQRILIIGASGSLGTSAVQLAKEFGTHVTGLCSTSNLDLVKTLGADEVIDYTVENFTQNGKTYDIIYDTVGKSSFSKSKSSLTENGTYLSPVLKLPLLFQLIWTSIFGKKKAKFAATGTRAVPELRRLLAELNDQIANGKLKMVIDKIYPLSEAAEAHGYVDKGHKKGNVILSIQ